MACLRSGSVRRESCNLKERNWAALRSARRAQPATGVWRFSCAPKSAGQRPALQERTACQVERLGIFLCSKSAGRRPALQERTACQVERLQKGASFSGLAFRLSPYIPSRKGRLEHLHCCSQKRRPGGPRYRNAQPAKSSAFRRGEFLRPCIQALAVEYPAEQVGWSTCIAVLPKAQARGPRYRNAQPAKSSASSTVQSSEGASCNARKIARAAKRAQPART